MVKCFCVENPKKEYPILFERGWGNGYLVFDRTHPLYGKHYDEINMSRHMQAHGDWTYSQIAGNHHLKNDIKIIAIENEELQIEADDWIIGFDTSHMGDDLDNCPKSFVVNHTKALKKYYSRIENFI
jgi:hypothetical protein